MVLRVLRVTALAAALAAATSGIWDAGRALAQNIAPVPDPVASAAPIPAAPMPAVAVPAATDLFYNYYVQGSPGCVPAQLYLCPRPTPPLVGHTYITYQPLMPHEFLYQHHRVYDRYDPDGGWTTTRVHWGHLPSLPPAFSKLQMPY